MKIKIKKMKSGEWMFTVVARNGRQLCDGRGYNSLAACKKTIFSLKDNLYGASWEVENGKKNSE